jgi:hypothetical protein
MDRCIYTDQTGISQLFTPIIYVEGPAVFPPFHGFLAVSFWFSLGVFLGFFLIRNFQGLKAGELIVGSYVTVLVGYIRLCLAYARLYSGE